MSNENKTTQSNKVAKSIEKRSASPLYATKRFGEVIKFLKENKFVDDEDLTKLKEVHKKIITKFLGYDLHE